MVDLDVSGTAKVLVKTGEESGVGATAPDAESLPVVPSSSSDAPMPAVSRADVIALMGR